MKLEAIIGCVGWWQMLQLCLRHNRQHFESVIVVTDTQDEQTKRVCQEFGSICVATDAWYRNGAKFDKGGAYNLALAHLRFHDWVAFLDPDILLPTTFRAGLSTVNMNPDVLYGIERVDVASAQDIELLRRGELTKTEGPAMWGWGYFQLFNINSRWLQGVAPICPSWPTHQMYDYHFRDRFGAGNWYDGKDWHWNPDHQKQLPTMCYHVVPPTPLPRVAGV